MPETIKNTFSFERIALGVVVALLSWNVNTTAQLVTGLAVTNANVSSLERSFEVASQDRYTRAEAKSDAALLDQRISRLEGWNERLANRINELENEVDVLRGKLDRTE